MRAVLNHHVTAEDIPTVLAAFEESLRHGAAADRNKVVIYG
jgi:hypothetical protein